MSTTPPDRPGKPVVVHIDGAARGNPGPASIGVAFLNESGRPHRTLSKYLGPATNNVAEYLAFVYALQDAQQHGVRDLIVKTDSELLARQFQGVYKVRDATLRLLHDLARQMAENFDTCRVEHVPREQNRDADRLANQALDERR